MKIKKETGKKVNTIRTDNGLEFVNSQMSGILFKEGVKHQKTVPYTPEQNGRAERDNRTIVESARILLFNANLPKAL